MCTHVCANIELAHSSLVLEASWAQQCLSPAVLALAMATKAFEHIHTKPFAVQLLARSRTQYMPSVCVHASTRVPACMVACWLCLHGRACACVCACLRVCLRICAFICVASRTRACLPDCMLCARALVHAVREG